MAWEAKLESAIIKAKNQTTVQAHVTYYDTAAPEVTLHEKLFQFDPAENGAGMLSAVRSEGAAARAAHTKAATLASANPAGTTWTVP